MTPYKPLLKPLRHPILCMKIFMSVSTFTGNQPIRQRSLFSNIKISLRIAHRLITSSPDVDHKMVTTPLAAIPFQLARLFILDPKRCGREPIIPIRRNHTMNKPSLTPQRNHDPPLRRNHMKLINRPNSHGHNRRRRLDHLRSARGASTHNPDHKQSSRPEYQPSPPQHHTITTPKDLRSTLLSTGNRRHRRTSTTCRDPFNGVQRSNSLSRNNRLTRSRHQSNGPEPVMTPYKPLLKPLRHPILCMKIFMSVSTFTGNQPIRQRSLFSNIKISLRIAHRLITSSPDVDHKMVTTPLAAIPFQLARLFILDPKRCGREPIIPIRRNHTMNKPSLTPQRNHDPPLRRNHMKLINRPNSHGHNRRRRLNHLKPTLGTPNQTRGYQKRQENTFPQALHTRSCGPCFKKSHHAIHRVRASSCLFFAKSMACRFCSCTSA